jgi:hypothetical protein
MKNVLALALLVCALFTQTATAQVSDKYRYLINATNEIHKAVSQSAAPDRAALLIATAAACSALTRLLEDKQFERDLLQLAERAPSSQQRRDQLRRELDLFILEFLRVEETWLREAGVDERAAKDILWSAGIFRTAVDSKIDPKHVLGVIGKLREDVCKGSRAIQDEEDSAKRWAKVRKWSFRLGGVTLIAVDIGSSVITGPVAAGSAAIGAAVAGWPE